MCLPQLLMGCDHKGSHNWTVSHLCSSMALLQCHYRIHVTGFDTCHVIGLLIRALADIEHNGLEYVIKVRSQLHAMAKEEGSDNDVSLNQVWRRLNWEHGLLNLVLFAFFSVQLLVMLWCIEKSLFNSNLESFFYYSNTSRTIKNQWTDSGGKKLEGVGEEINSVISEILYFHLSHDVGKYIHVVSTEHRGTETK